MNCWWLVNVWEAGTPIVNGPDAEMYVNADTADHAEEHALLLYRVRNGRDAAYAWAEPRDASPGQSDKEVGS